MRIPEEVTAAAEEFGAPIKDTFIMHLNLSGLQNTNLDDRLRMFLRFPSDYESFFLILSTDRPASPYMIHEGGICVGEDEVLGVENARPDLALTGYKRHAGKAITLNTNFRTGCTGCVFCPNTFSPSIARATKAAIDVHEQLNSMNMALEQPDWSAIEDVVLSTGCFRSSDEAIKHLADVQKWLKLRRFEGSLGILSTEFIEPSDIDRLKSVIDKPRIIFTLECFERRSLILRESKARISPDSILAAIAYAHEIGVETGITYLLGLDSLDSVLERLPDFFPHLTTFPNIQVFQTHNSIMDGARAPNSHDLGYYLRARDYLGECLESVGLEPEPWRNYRSPWLFEFQGRELTADMR